VTAPVASARPNIAITLGDPAGIGPEVIVKALADPALRASASFRIFGLESELRRAADLAGVPPFWLRLGHASELPGAAGTVLVIDHAEQPASDAPTFDRVPGPDARSGELSFRFVEGAIAAARLPAGDPFRVDAVVTAPISKEAWAMAGHRQFPGHTELFASRFGVTKFGMLFDSPALRVILATVHLPLMNVRDVLTTARVLETIELGHEGCRRLGVASPRIAVCGLNPHAGERGLLGEEDSRIIAPAIARAAAAGIDASGPFPADTVFNAAVGSAGRPGRFDLVVAMYHDQGLIPVKLLAWDTAVNITVGLPIVRTSPDHGTAFDIAGQNRAEAGSMKRAIQLAIRMLGTMPAPR
jgi:4-hydroxythreonine-4-phosphate dehydrogenase